MSIGETVLQLSTTMIQYLLDLERHAQMLVKIQIHMHGQERRQILGLDRGGTMGWMIIQVTFHL